MKLNWLLLGIVIFLFVCLGLTSIKTREGVTYGTPVTFNYTGGVQYWTCPKDVTKVEVELWGAQGGGENQSSTNDYNGWRYGNNSGHPGGRGGYGKIEMPVTPGKKYVIYVGGEGKYHANTNRNNWHNEDLDGGWPNGGSSKRNQYYNNYYWNYNYYYYNGYEIYRKVGTGGGSTSIHKPGGSLTDVNNILAVAGGGGGSGGYSQGRPGFGVGMGINFRGTGTYVNSNVRGRNWHAAGSHGQSQNLSSTMKGGDAANYYGHWLYRGGGGGGGINKGEPGANGYVGSGGYYFYPGEGGTGYINPNAKIKIKAQAMGISIGTAGGRITGPQGGDAIPRVGNGMLRIRQIITHKKLSTGYCMPMSPDGLNNPAYKGKWSLNKERTASGAPERLCINPNGFEIGGNLEKGAIGGDDCITSATRAGCITACKNAGLSSCSSPDLPKIDKCAEGQSFQGEAGGKSFMKCNKCLDGYIMASDGQTCKAPVIKGCANQGNNSLICAGCKTGYSLVDNKCKVNDIPNCADQGSPKGTECKSCGKGYAKSGNTCSLQPILGCKEQKGISCAECNLGHHYDKPPPSQNRCLITPIKYCVDQRKIFCHECQTKWIPSEDRRTCKIIPPIKWCQIQRGKICETCVKGYTVGEDKISCKKDPKPEKAVPGKSGDRGPIGPTGAKGEQGLIGPEGRPAGIGDPGWRGPTGKPGDTGPDGPEGNIGPTGAVGHRGEIGPKGPTTVIDPWANKAIVNSLKNIYTKIKRKNQEYTGKKNPPINLNIRMGHLGDGEIQSVHRSTETLGENIDMDIGNLNPGKDKTEDLSMLEGFNTYTYIR